MYPFMEAPHPPYPPEYDHPEATKQEILDVLYGRRIRDGLGRDVDDLLSDTAMMLWQERIANDPDAERELMEHIGKYRHALPRVAAIFDQLAGETEREPVFTWSHKT